MPEIQDIITKEMDDFFKKRTMEHISRVQKNMRKILKSDISKEIDVVLFKTALKEHDKSKYSYPEHQPYILITWDYKCKDKGIDSKLSESTHDVMNKATEHHVKTNEHHPEYWSDKEVGIINRGDRDKPPEEMIDVTRMPSTYIAEMVADWMAMSEEKGTCPYEWAKKNIGVRWKFSNSQKDFIYEILNTVWRSGNKYTIYLDMDGVLTDFRTHFENCFGINLDKDKKDYPGELIFSEIAKYPHWWDSIPWMPGGKELVEAAMDISDNVELLTTPAFEKDVPTCRQDKLSWVKRELGDLPVIFSYNKENFAKKNAILIDDKPDNIKEFVSAGGIGILYKNHRQAIRELRNITCK